MTNCIQSFQNIKKKKRSILLKYCHTDLHVFNSIMANFAVVCAIVYQTTLISEGLITTKSWFSKHNVAISILELISTHMRANLVENVNLALQNQNVRLLTGWTDSTVVLHSLNITSRETSNSLLGIEWKRPRRINLAVGFIFRLKKTQQI